MLDQDCYGCDAPHLTSIAADTHFVSRSDTQTVENCRIEWEYERVGDAYVPKKVHFLLNDTAGRPSFDSHVEIVKSMLNEPIAPELFTWRSLKLDEETRLIDNIQRLEFTHRNGKLVPASFAHVVKEVSDQLLEGIDEEVMEGTPREVLLPRVASARKYGRPFLLDFKRGKLFFVHADLSTDTARDFLEEEAVGDIAWDGSLLAVRRAKAFVPDHESHRPLGAAEDKAAWIRGYGLPMPLELPYALIVVANDGEYYLTKVSGVEPDGVRVVYRELGPGEIDRCRSRL